MTIIQLYPILELCFTTDAIPFTYLQLASFASKVRLYCCGFKFPLYLLFLVALLLAQMAHGLIIGYPLPQARFYLLHIHVLCFPGFLLLAYISLRLQFSFHN
jgi:hypothetical protein